MTCDTSVGVASVHPSRAFPQGYTGRMVSKKKEVWDKPDPSKKDKKLTPEQKSAAKARAK